MSDTTAQLEDMRRRLAEAQRTIGALLRELAEARAVQS